MLNSHDNPECNNCKQRRTVGCGTKMVDGRRTHIAIYNCYRDGTMACTPCKQNNAPAPATNKDERT